MAAVNLNELKARFAVGDQPTAKDYVDLIDTLAAVAANSVDNAALQADSVTEDKIVDDAVTTNKIADGSVTPIKIEPGGNNTVLQTNGSGEVVWDVPFLSVTTIGNRSITQAKMTFNSGFWVTDTGTADALAVTFTPAMAATPLTGTILTIKKNSSANTGAVTLTVDGGTTYAVKKNSTAALEAGDLPASVVFAVAFDGVQWNLVGKVDTVINPYTTGRTYVETGMSVSTDMTDADVEIATVNLTLPATKVWKWIRVVFATEITTNGSDSAGINSLKVKLSTDEMTTWMDILNPSGLALAGSPAITQQFVYISEGEPISHINDTTLTVKLFANKNGSTNGDDKTKRKWYVIGDYY